MSWLSGIRGDRNKVLELNSSTCFLSFQFFLSKSKRNL
jgi:hypothetical protein